MASPLSHFSKEELLKKLKTQKQYLLIQTILVVLMVALAVLSTLEKGISFLKFLPLFFIPMQLVMFFELKKIKRELKNKN